jgi:tRNA G46 methylase TrmB
VIKIYPFSHFSPTPDDEFQRGSIVQLRKDDMNLSIFGSDAEFDRLYPERFQLMSFKQWTPLAIARKVAEFLAEPNAKVLDIGSGIGKFCLTGAYHYPETLFYGVEQRQELIHLANKASRDTQLPNAIRVPFKTVFLAVSFLPPRLVFLL